MTYLAAEVARHKALKEQLLAAFPELGDDEQALVDTLDGLSDLSDMIAAVIRAALMREAMAEGCRKREQEIATRRARLSEGAEKLRRVVRTAMEDAGLKKIAADDVTISLKESRGGVVVLDEAAVPDEYLRHPPPRPDKRAIAEALDAGKQVPGCCWSNAQMTLAVRVK